jgi:hypothetical protein
MAQGHYRRVLEPEVVTAGAEAWEALVAEAGAPRHNCWRTRPELWPCTLQAQRECNRLKDRCS